MTGRATRKAARGGFMTDGWRALQNSLNGANA
ncbi:hypothetical protein HNQ10_000002 [Deinococcus metallilatus]|uniref:Uncharacterized protein n=1 Tax=Deinococcus metallilatus TaxID=1211322 RepID=A0ABR6MMK8_9DEIO|nr:hypothetical protein [Deinococcus metallilatus]